MAFFDKVKLQEDSVIGGYQKGIYKVHPGTFFRWFDFKDDYINSWFKNAYVPSLLSRRIGSSIQRGPARQYGAICVPFVMA